MKAGRLPSIGVTRLPRYYSPLRLLACRSRFSSPYTVPFAAITRDKRVLPRFPAKLPSHPVPTTPESSSALPSRLHAPMTAAFPTGRRGRHSHLQVTRLYGFLGSTGCEFAMLRAAVSFLDLLPSRFGAFSFRSALRVAPQDWIFASGVNQEFPAPDFNRLVPLLPRRTVRH